MVEPVGAVAVRAEGAEPRQLPVSILFTDCADRDLRGQPACFADLNLDRVVAAITAGRQEYRLEPFFSAPLDKAEEIAYRQDVFRDLIDDALRRPVEAFAQSMRAVRKHTRVVGDLHYARRQQAWFLDAVALYCADESFTATNEREGLEIARQVVHALLDRGVAVAFVTHFYDLAESLYEEGLPALFLQPERTETGERTFRIVEGEPLPTSYGEDVYHRVFADTRSADVAL